MLFKDVVGLQDVKQNLVDMVAHNRLSHALLFLGKEGSGALPLALAFANYVCLSGSITNAVPTLDMFGETPTPKLPVTPDEVDVFLQQHASFGKINTLAHPDIHYTYPVFPKKSGEKPLSTDFITEWRSFVLEQPYSNAYDWLQYIKAENKQGNISANECGEILRKLSLKSFESEYKILVLWMPEFLGNEGNRLLKLIEEPPPNTLFILVAENEEQIINTILSRTQLIKVPLPENEEVIQYLRIKCDVVKAMQITGIAEGNVREALQLLNETSENWFDLLRETMNMAVAGKPTMIMAWVGKMAELGRERQKNFLLYYIKMLDFFLRLNIIGSNNILLPDAEKDFLVKMQKFVNLSQVEALSKLLDNNIYYIERNANAKMLFHALMIRMQYIIKNNSVILLG
jgi:DNA polymerase III subunit delta'